MRRGSIVSLIAIGVVAGAVASAIALFIPWLPEEASVEAGRINFLIWFATVMCIAIFSVVAAVLVYSAWKFRALPDDWEDGPPIHGHTGLEIWWTAIPAVLVTVLAIVSAVVLAKNEDATNAMPINVWGEQFAWSFEYPAAGGFKTTQLRLPVDQRVKLTLQAKDVIHSFWVPNFGQKQDAVPGLETELVITPKKLGRYPIVCTELCGLGHPTMRSEVVVVSRGDFEEWIRSEQQAAGP